MFTYGFGAQKNQLIETVLLSSICEMKKMDSSISLGGNSGRQTILRIVSTGRIGAYDWVTVSYEDKLKYCKFPYGNLVIKYDMTGIGNDHFQ